MIALNVAKLKIFTPEIEISLGIKHKKNVFGESMDQFRSLEVREKVRNVFVMSLRLSDHQVLHNIASSSSFFDFARIFFLFSLVFRTSKLLEFKEFNKTRPSVRIHWVACGTCSVPGNFFQVGVCSRYNARSDWLIVTGPRADYGLAKTI